MALVKCKECGKEVSSKAATCPECGISKPGALVGQLIVQRVSAMTAAMYDVQVLINGERRGEIKNGGRLVLELPTGSYELSLRGGGLSRSIPIQVSDGKDVRLKTYFSAWGILGGGLKIEPG